jgi:hypothetical protein
MPSAAPDEGDTAGPEKEFQENRDIRVEAKKGMRNPQTPSAPACARAVTERVF